VKNNTLIVSEVFYSIQGEGQTVGIPAVFLRLGGCNLLCEGAGWRCDTIEVWQKGNSLYFQEVIENPEWIERLKQGAHLVITGGEPLLHQNSIVNYLKWFRGVYNFLPIIEVETNGTIIPISDMFDYVHYWNVSPKLPSSGAGSYEKRVNELAIKEILRLGKDSIFKFVISYKADWVDVSEEYDFVPNEKIMLMPAGDTQELLNFMRPIVVDMCKQFCVQYSERLHIVIWNKKTGV